MASCIDRRWLGFLCLCLVNTTACAAATRRTVGATVMAMGGVTGLAGVHLMAGGCSRRNTATLRDQTGEAPCVQYAEPDPQAGAMVLMTGLTALMAGGVLLASGIPSPAPAAASAK